MLSSITVPLAMDTPFKVVFGDGGAPLGSLKVERWLGIALLSTLGPMLYIFLAMLPLGCCEHQRHCDRLLDYSYGIGVTHIGTIVSSGRPSNACKPIMTCDTTIMIVTCRARDCAPLHGE